MTLYFVIFSDEVDEYVITESEPTSLQISTPPSSNISVHETSPNCQLLFWCNYFVKTEVSNTIYEDYVQFKHVNDIIKSVQIQNFEQDSDENNFQKNKIKLLKVEIKKV